MFERRQIIKAPAKINLFLLVGSAQSDGYHPICSLMAKINLFDRLSIERLASGEASVSGGNIPPQENIVYRAIKALELEAQRPLPVAVELEKEIPIAAGLAGGSSDAVAALMQLVACFNLDISPRRLAMLAKSLGADLPFFLQPGMQLAEGIGERLQPVKLAFPFHLVLAMPEASLATAQVYRLFDQLAAVSSETFDQRCRFLKKGLDLATGIDELAALLVNDLEPAAASLCPEIDRLKGLLQQAGAAGVLMSGSGPSVFGIFASRDMAQRACTDLVDLGIRAWPLEPLP